MNTNTLTNTKKRAHKITYLKGESVFIKEYEKINEININKLIKEEYLKGKKLSKLINYPEPLKLEKNKIIYEFIEIKYSLYELLNIGKIDYPIIRRVAKVLRKIHDFGIIHGDFYTENIVITRNNKLYFIDASFSKYANNYRVEFDNKNIYQDISLFLVFLKWIRPLSFFPQLILKRKKLKKAELCFLNTYFKGNMQEFDSKRNAIMENFFYKIYYRYICENKRIYIKIIWKFLIKFLILINKKKI